MDWSNPAGQAISGGFGILGGFLNYKYNQRLAAQQNQYNLDMWKMQNEYNSPAAQMRRFEEAGLNPALMYGQGNSGNATSAPQMVTPKAPDYTEGLKELSQAFNIEGLRTAIANRKKAQADAKMATVDADRNELQYEAERNLGLKYTFDPNTGLFVERPLDPEGVVTVPHRSAFYANRFLSENFRTNALLIPRSTLINSQSYLNEARKSLLAPQIRYQNFVTTPWRMKTNWWIGNVKNGVQAVAPFVTPFL